MATVYLATDVRHNREVAVKVLRPELAAALGPERFLREVEIAARLQHPHILPLYDSGEAEGFLYYVMPYADGESLRERIDNAGELPVHEAVRILRDIVDALARAHQQGVVHRDIKPANVMLSGRHALVMDFGVAKAVSDASKDQGLTTAGVALGTPVYMAPEQASADPHMDHRADLYAVGIMAYEMLAGRPPFTGRSTQAILAAHMTEDPVPLAKLRPAVSPQLNALVMRCLEKRPADRIQSADDVLQQLDEMATPSGGVTPMNTRPIPAMKKRGTPRWIWIAAAAVILVAAALGGWILTRGSGSQKIDRIAVLSIEDISGQDSVFVEAMQDALTNALSRLQLVGVAPRSAVAAYRTSSKPTREIAQELDVNAVVEATVFRAGDVMRINVQFTDPATTRSLWADTYERNVQDVLAAQNDVVGRIADGIRGVLSPDSTHTGAGG